MNGYLAVSGLDELIAGLEAASTETQIAVKDGLREAGEIVRKDASQLFSRYSLKSSQGYRVRVRTGRGVQVEQSLRKVTGKRPDYGSLQMRKALIPALHRNETTIQEAVTSTLELMLKREHLKP